MLDFTATRLDFQALPAAHAADSKIIFPPFLFEATIPTFILLFFFRATQTSAAPYLSAQNYQYPSPAIRSHGEAISSFLATGSMWAVELGSKKFLEDPSFQIISLEMVIQYVMNFRRLHLFLRITSGGFLKTTYY